MAEQARADTEQVPVSITPILDIECLALLRAMYEEATFSAEMRFRWLLSHGDMTVLKVFGRKYDVGTKRGLDTLIGMGYVVCTLQDENNPAPSADCYLTYAGIKAARRFGHRLRWRMASLSIQSSTLYGTGRWLFAAGLAVTVGSTLLDKLLNFCA